MVNDLLSPLVKHRFGVLLGLQGMLLLAAAFTQDNRFQEEIFLLTLIAVLLGGGLALVRGTRHSIPFSTMAALTVAANIFQYFSSWPEADLAACIVNLVFMGWVTLALASRVFLERRVDENIILGAACLYTHIGMIFGFIYLLVDFFVPHSFQGLTSNGTPDIGLYPRQFLYYSYVTLTTVGYGDIVPASAAARYISVIETLIGQLYLAILVSRLVGIHLTAQTGDRK